MTTKWVEFTRFDGEKILYDTDNIVAVNTYRVNGQDRTGIVSVEDKEGFTVMETYEEVFRKLTC